MRHDRRWQHSGFTLIELMVTIAVVIVMIALAAPSFRQVMDTQRVRGTANQLLTDMQFARTEAASRGARVRLTFNFSATQTCYTIYTYANPGQKCDCLQASPCGAAGNGYVEIKTVRLPRSTGTVRVIPDLSVANTPMEFAFEPLTGGLYTVPKDVAYDILSSYTVRAFVDTSLELRVVVGQSGRPYICQPSSSKISEVAC